ncbi:MAG: hypothetical protein LBS87_01885 [Puniceicoccales bacterium]|nr:hypothetical protein [Puniceicoccales bacterium]
MTFKGTFGTDTSTTGEDLPATGMLDGDMYVCLTDYYKSSGSVILRQRTAGDL